MRFVVVGAGAIGGGLGARLAQAGHDVVLVARGEHLAAIRGGGLRVEAPDGVHVQPIAAIESVRTHRWRDGEVVLLAIKTQDAAAALAELAACAPPATPIACLTNGLEAERLALRSFACVHAVCVMSPATFVRPGVVQQWGEPVRGIFDLGRYPGHPGGGTDALDAELAAAFRSAGYESEACADVMAAKRTKLLMNLSNAIEALCGPGLRASSLAQLARLEGIACYEAAGLSRVSDADDAARRANLRSGTIDGAKRGGGSTWQSLVRGASSLECDYLNGEIVLLGRLHGVPTPVNAMLQREAARAAAAHLPPGSLTLDDLIAKLAPPSA
jgi:2-dehydropantoate 2-reductase